MAVPVLHGDGCQPGLHHDPVRPGTVQFGQRALVGGAVLQGEAVPEGSEALLFVTGVDAVAHRLGDSLPEALLEGAGAVGDGPEGLPEGGLVECVGTLAVSAASWTISCQPDWWVSWQSWWSRWKTPACWWQ